MKWAGTFAFGFCAMATIGVFTYLAYGDRGWPCVLIASVAYALGLARGLSFNAETGEEVEL